MWPLADLAMRVERALDMAERAIALVADATPAVDLVALEAPPDKVIAETAMLLRGAGAIPPSRGPRLAQRAHALARELLPLARSARVIAGLLIHPALARDYAAAHVVLAEMGLPDAAIDRALAAATSASTVRARERLPHRELEQEWLATLGGRPMAMGATLQRTALVRGVDLLTGTRDDVYAFTHAVMYVTDFGARPLPRTRARAALPTAASALAGALDDDDFDLMAELLLTWPLTGTKWGPDASFAFAVVAAVEDDVGLLPSLALGADTVKAASAVARAQSLTAATYHTAYVMGLLCAAILRAGGRPRRSPDLFVGGRLDLADALVESLRSDHHPQWLIQMRAAAPKVRAACVSLLVDVALRRAVRRLDLAALRRLLEDARRADVGASVLAAQAAALLQRVATCGELLCVSGSHARDAHRRATVAPNE